MKLRFEEGDHNVKRVWLEDVVVNGQNVDIEISQIVTAVTIRTDIMKTWVSLELSLGTWAEVDTKDVQIDFQTTVMLEALGWTPPTAQ